VKLKAQLKEAKVIEENLTSQLDEKKCLEADKRDNILIDHLKERTDDLN
jgi:hypothetical protein